jgi:hypothetical protein
MSGLGEGQERLAEILREILDLTKTAQNVPKSSEVVEAANVHNVNIELPELLGSQCPNWIHKRGAASGQKTGEQGGHSE